MKKLLLVLGFAAVGSLVQAEWQPGGQITSVDDYRQYLFTQRIAQAYGYWDDGVIHLGGKDERSNGLHSGQQSSSYLFDAQSQPIKEYFKAVLHGDVVKIKQLLDAKKIDLNQKIYTLSPVTDEQQKAAIMKARQESYDQAIALMKARGMEYAGVPVITLRAYELNFIDQGQWLTPLAIAIVLARPEVVDLLIECGADVHAVASIGSNILEGDFGVTTPPAFMAFIQYVQPAYTQYLDGKNSEAIVADLLTMYKHICEILIARPTFDVAQFTTSCINFNWCRTNSLSALIGNKENDALRANLPKGGISYQTATVDQLQRYMQKENAISQPIYVAAFKELMQPKRSVVSLLQRKGVDVYAAFAKSCDRIFENEMQESIEEMKKIKQRDAQQKQKRQAKAVKAPKKGSVKKAKVRKTSIAVAA